jgi:hypothetical protein
VIQSSWQEFMAQVPPGAVSGPITVLTDGGTGSSTNEFVVLAPLGGVRRETGGGLSFGVSNAVVGGRNLVQAATNLHPPVIWQSVATNQVSGPAVWRYTNGNLNSFQQRFFRVRME